MSELGVRVSRGSVVGIVLATAACMACTNGDGRTAGPAASVAGEWCGRPVASPVDCRGDEVFFAVLAQDESVVTGQFCEAYELDCYDIADGVVAGRTVSFHYEFDDGGAVARVDVDADVSTDGDTMTGTAFSSKCACELDLTLFRL